MGRSSTVGIRSCIIAVACLALVAGIALSDTWGQAVDSQSIVGKWEGTWLNISHPNFGGDYSVTVTKIDGNQVYGRYEKLGAAGGRVTSEFIGKLEDGKLTYSNSFSSTELELSGNQLRGTSVDNFRLAIQMTRSK